MMARCNHLLALPSPAAALPFANAASCCAWADGPCFYRLRRRHQPPGAPAASSSVLRRRPASRYTSAFHDTAAKPRGRNCFQFESSRNYGGEDGCDIVSSLRDSLRHDVVQPHIDAISDASTIDDDEITNIQHSMPTLVLVMAVSGGCDSTALFHAVLALARSDGRDSPDRDAPTAGEGLRRAPPFWLHLGDNVGGEGADFEVPCEIHVAHFNHEQRGTNSDGDEAFVAKLCEESGVPFHSYSWSEEDVPARDSSKPAPDSTEIENQIYSGACPDVTDGRGRKPSSFTQDVARNWRRTSLRELLARLVLLPDDTSRGSHSKRWGAVLTAHHRDDADETILLKLLRGSHLRNLSGMDARSDVFDLRMMQSADKGSDAKDGEASSVGYFAKPMLNVRKIDIVRYLESNALEWREDESNDSNKYKRNKIRNELMPLLCDLAGGEQALQRRMKSLEQQSREVSMDYDRRSDNYLENMPSGSEFFLPNDSEAEFGLLEEEALHKWIIGATGGQLRLPYDQMLKIRNQIRNFPKRLQWALEVGKHWTIQRNGQTLYVTKSGKVGTRSSGTDCSHDRGLPWTIVQPDSSDERQTPGNSDVVHELILGRLPDDGALALKRVKDSGNLKFRPPWRKSNMKLREFLRGQKVPLHLRDEATVLCVSDESATHALAVYIDDTEDNAGKWIVNGDFCPHGTNLRVTKVVLGKTLLA